MKRVALTFDDGPDPVTTPALLATLASYHAVATFMLWGEHVAADPNLVKQIVAAGHAIGNHTYTHRSLVGLSPGEIQTELTRTDEAVFAATGLRTTFFRPPFGEIDAAVAAAARRPAVTWRVDSEDWRSHDAPSIIQRVTTLTQPGDVVLMHDGQPATVQALPEILQRLTAAQYRFVTVPALFHRLQAGYLYAGEQAVQPLIEGRK